VSADRFDPEPVLARIEERIGVTLEFIAMAEQGFSGGAAYVRWPGGTTGVLTCPPVPAERMHLAAEILLLAKSRGVPVPRHDLIVALDAGSCAVVQERLQGRHIQFVGTETVDAMVTMNDRFAGLLRDRPDVPNAPLRLRNDPRHEVLEQYDDRTRRILRRIREIGSESPDLVPGDDLLHMDYARGNVLTDESGCITGVVDWNSGVARGDRLCALVWLRSDLEWSALFPPGAGGVDPGAIDRLDQIITERVDPVLLPAYWAHWTIERLSNLVTDGAKRAIDLFLELGSSRLG
jgi:aminoglycoside phosphotransferase (APT) family kinase protein